MIQMISEQEVYEFEDAVELMKAAETLGLDYDVRRGTRIDKNLIGQPTQTEFWKFTLWKEGTANARNVGADSGSSS